MTDAASGRTRGRQQAEELVRRLEGLPIRAIVRSPLLRCERTVAPLAAALGAQAAGRSRGQLRLFCFQHFQEVVAHRQRGHFGGQGV